VVKKTGVVQKSNKHVSFVSTITVVVLVALAVAAYFFIVTSFFRGWQNAKFFDDVPDMVFLVVSLTFLYYAFGFKRSPAKKWLILGISLLVLVKLIEIPLQELQALTPGVSLEVIFWMPPIIMFGLGFLCILQYLGERVK